MQIGNSTHAVQRNSNGFSTLLFVWKVWSSVRCLSYNCFFFFVLYRPRGRGPIIDLLHVGTLTRALLPYALPWDRPVHPEKRTPSARSPHTTVTLLSKITQDYVPCYVAVLDISIYIAGAFVSMSIFF